MIKSLNYLLLFLLLWTSGCKSNKQNADPIPSHDSLRIESKILNESRRINIWKPENYDEITDSLPVMYMADGGLMEDFPHITHTFDTLIKTKQIPAFILVGIENTQRRRDLTGITNVEEDKKVAPVIGGSEKFRAFIKDELIPEINKLYRTHPKKGILGESLSGYFVMESFFLEPELFDYYIAFDPSIWWNNHNLVRTAGESLQKMPANKKVLWFAGSDAEDINQYTKQLSDSLKNNSPATLNWKYSDEPQQQHQTIFRATKEKALIWSLNQ